MFEGGGAAAAAGLGGIDGARRLLNLDDINNGGIRSTFLPVSLSIIPGRESRTWTMMATSASGIRMYFTSLSNTISTYGGIKTGQHLRAIKLVLCYVKAPPELSKAKAAGQLSSLQLSNEQLRSQQSWHCSDISIFATAGGSNNVDEGDMLIGALSDYAITQNNNASTLGQTRMPEGDQTYTNRGAHSTELVCSVNEPSPTLPGGKVWKIVGEFDSKASYPEYYSRSKNESSSIPKALPAPFVPKQESNISSGFGISSILRGDYMSPVAKRRKVPGSTSSHDVTTVTHVTPLPIFATRTAPKRILVLTTGTLHIFNYKSIFDSLYQRILSSSSDSLKDWIDAYGSIETVCMMLHLASTFSEQSGFLNRCIDAIVKHGLVPSSSPFDAKADSRPMTHTAGSQSMHLSVPSQATLYNPTVLQNALYLNTARILRSVWQTPAVICHSDNDFTLVSDKLCDMTQTLISGIIKVMKKGLTEVVQSDPFSETSSGTLSNGGISKMDTDDDNKEDWITSRQTPVQRRPSLYQHGGNGNGSNHINSSKQKQLERESVHSLYRLLTRAHQLFSLLRILRFSNDKQNRIKWGQLHSICIADLVCNPGAQERIDLLLDGFLESDESNQSLLTQLEQQCYLYYSKGVRYLAMGYATDGSAATKWFRLAARYWQR